MASRKTEDDIAARPVGPLQRPGPKPGEGDPQAWKAGKRHGLDAVLDADGGVVASVNGLKEVGLAGARKRAGLLASAGRLKEQLARAVRLLMADPCATEATYEAVADMDRVMAESEGA